jgi:ribosome-associated protein
MIYSGEKLEHEQLKEFVKHKLEDVKGRDIIDIDVTGKSSVTDTYMICSGNSKRHVVSIAQNLVQESKQAGEVPLNVEGQDLGEWVLIDYGDVVVHVMQEQTRDFYQLEKLWS